MKRLLAFSLLLATASVAHATAYVVWGANVNWLVASTSSGSDFTSGQVHMLEWVGGTGTFATNHPWCGHGNGGRAYILDTDKTIYATLLAAKIAGKPVSFYFEDAAETKSVFGHGIDGRCKIVSVWIP